MCVCVCMRNTLKLFLSHDIEHTCMPSELALRLLLWCGSWPTATALFWWWYRLDLMLQSNPISHGAVGVAAVRTHVQLPAITDPPVREGRACMHGKREGGGGGGLF